MNVDQALALSQQVLAQVRSAKSAFRTLPGEPTDLDEFYAFHDDPKQQQAIIERGRTALSAFVAGFEQVKDSAENVKVFIRELKTQVGELTQTMKAADPSFDVTPVDAAVASVVFKPTSRALAAAGPNVPTPGARQEATALFAVLARSKEEKAMLEQVAAKALSVGKQGGVTQVAFDGTVVTCARAAKPAASVPASYAALARVFGSVSWKHGGGASMGYLGVGKSGKLANGSWESEALTEGDNAKFLAALEKAGLEPGDVKCAFACGSNWILFDPTRTTKRGEPALGFVSHADCEWVSLKASDDHDAAAVLLRLMAWSLAGAPAPYEEISA